MEFTIDKFNTVKREAEQLYNSVGTVKCPYFNGEEVHFNSKGFEHLIFKGFNRTRPIQDQFSRLRHLKLAPEIIRQSKTLQGFHRIQKLERIRRNSKWQKVSVIVSHYEFIAVMDSHDSKVRVKIVVKQIEGGEKHFLSIIPFWGRNKVTGEKILYSGHPEND